MTDGDTDDGDADDDNDDNADDDDDDNADDDNGDDDYGDDDSDDGTQGSDLHAMEVFKVASDDGNGQGEDEHPWCQLI